MSRHSFLLVTTLVLLAVISTPESIAQGANLQNSSSVEVVYVWKAGGINKTGVTVETYNVDRSTGVARSQGQITLPFESVWAIQPAPNDRFIYVYARPEGEAGEVLVYPTDPNGVPQTTPVQRLDGNVLYFLIDPNGLFAYGPGEEKSQQGLDILLVGINPDTGLVQPPKVVAHEPLNGPCSQWLEPYGPILLGFNYKGTQLYEKWSCDGYDDVFSTYYTRTIDQQTGALSAPVQTVSTFGVPYQGTSVNFAPDAIVEFTADDPPINENLSVFPLRGGTSPLFTCTNQMLEECGNALSATIDPSGENIFFQITSDTVEIARFLPNEKKVVGTGNYLLGSVTFFSPDDRLVYALEGPVLGPYYVDIYVFDPLTGIVTNNIGGSFDVPQNYWFVPALRR